MDKGRIFRAEKSGCGGGEHLVLRKSCRTGSDMAHVESLLNGFREVHVCETANCIVDNRFCFLSVENRGRSAKYLFCWVV
jgi:hypothetical protein